MLVPYSISKVSFYLETPFLVQEGVIEGKGSHDLNSHDMTNKIYSSLIATMISFRFMQFLLCITEIYTVSFCVLYRLYTRKVVSPPASSRGHHIFLLRSQCITERVLSRADGWCHRHFEVMFYDCEKYVFSKRLNQYSCTVVLQLIEAAVWISEKKKGPSYFLSAAVVLPSSPSPQRSFCALAGL